MKKLMILISFSFLSCCGFTQSNIYYPLPTQDTYWREYTGGYQCGFCADYQNFTTGDTVIKGRSYTKFWVSGVEYAEDWLGYCTSTVIGHFSHYNSAIRNDSANKKVYCYDSYYGIDTLLYDFNLNLYDTLPQTLTYDSTGILSYISNIDSILIGPNYHKRFTISDFSGSWPDYGYLIEGIGSSFGLFGQIFPFFECGSGLKCVKQNGVTIYSVYTGDTICDLIEEMNENFTNEFPFQIFPNPCGSYIKVSSSRMDKVSLQIFDLLGQMVLNASNLKNGSRINLSSLKPGFYSYILYNSDNLLRLGKLIKQ